MAKEKWIDIQVSKGLYKKMQAGEIGEVELVPPKVEKLKDVPYLEVIITGKPSEKRFENFDKVKFPALCIYGWNKEQLGVINMCYLGGDNPTYELHRIDKQYNGINRESGFDSLEEMHELYNIKEIVKAKIIAKRGQ